MRGDKWLCTREGAAGIQGGTGGSPGASRGCGLGTAGGTAGAASGRRAEPHAPAAPCSVGYRQAKEWETHFFWVFGSELPARGLVQRQTLAGPRARPGTGSGCHRPPRLLLPFSPAAEPRLGFAETELQRHRKTIRTEGKKVINDGPSALQGLIKQPCIRPGKRRCSGRRDAVGRRLRPEL